MSDNPTIYCDLIEEQPLTRKQWEATPDGCQCRESDQRYAEYVARFQPWHVALVVQLSDITAPAST